MLYLSFAQGYKSGAFVSSVNFADRHHPAGTGGSRQLGTGPEIAVLTTACGSTPAYSAWTTRTCRSFARLALLVGANAKATSEARKLTLPAWWTEN